MVSYHKPPFVSILFFKRAVCFSGNELKETGFFPDIGSMKVRFFCTLLVFFLLLPFSVAARQKTHIVEKGETLYSLSRKYNVTVSELAKINDFSAETHIKAGQKLVIPVEDEDSQQESGKTPSFHIVQKGETLYAIARRYQTTVEKIASDNRLKNNVIFAGQKLSLNGAGSDTGKETSVPPAAKKTVAAAEVPPKKNTAVISAASDAGAESAGKTDKKKVVAANKKWPAAGDVYYFQGKIPGIEIDIKEKSDIVSVCNGTIKTASVFRGYGHVVVVEAYNKMLYTYAGFDSLSVREGDAVKAGEKIGEADAAVASKIYLFVYQNGTAVNPVSAPRF